MKIAIAGCRLLLGLGFIVFGLNLLHPFLPMPRFAEGSLPAQFMAIMVPIRWMALVALFEMSGGALVLFGRTAPVGLILLAPVLVNILAFHILLMGGEGIGPGFVFTLLAAFLAYSYRAHFTPILTPKPVPVKK
jgi:uncharacterized membrane protein YphA (DoxX/SURF4 family)